MNKTTILIASLLGGVLVAQEPPAGQPDKRPPTTTTPQDRLGQQAAGQTQQSDQVLVSWLLVDNENEVALAKLAVQRAQDPQVKEFAQRMIDDHGKMVQKLQQLRGGADGRIGRDTPNTGTPNTGSTGKPDSTTPGRDGMDKDPTTRDAREASGTRTAAAGDFDHLQLIRDLGSKCRQSSTEMLQQKQGAEFDRCYMGMQVGMHMKAVDTLEVFSGYASPSLRTALQESLQTVKQHKQQAEKLAKQTDEAAKTGAAGGR